MRPTTSSQSGASSAPRSRAAPDLGAYGLAVFDKDGTLIDFDAMWGGWVQDLSERLRVELGTPIGTELHRAIGFDPATGRAVASGPLAAMPMTAIRHLVERVVVSTGRGGEDAEAIVSRCWHPPDPVSLAHPLADLPALFARLRARGTRIAVATADDRAPTEATLAALGVSALVDVLACADDGRPIKPSPSMVLDVCRRTDVEPARTALVGDAPADLKMGRAAGVGLRVGVLSGVGTTRDLAPLADVLIASIAALHIA